MILRSYKFSKGSPLKTISDLLVHLIHLIQASYSRCFCYSFCSWCILYCSLSIQISSPIVLINRVTLLLLCGPSSLLCVLAACRSILDWSLPTSLSLVLHGSSRYKVIGLEMYYCSKCLIFPKCLLLLSAFPCDFLTT